MNKPRLLDLFCGAARSILDDEMKAKCGASLYWHNCYKGNQSVRWRRKDADKGRDWHNGETLKIVYHPRHEHVVLGIAQIIRKEPKQCQMITDEEAIADGFEDVGEMMDFLNPPPPAGMQIINKLTLYWLAQEVKVEAQSG